MYRLGAMVTVVCLLAVVTSHCGDGPLSSDTCRLDPQHCTGGAGTRCDDDRQCHGGLFCCQEKTNCGGGMCTLSCVGDLDCPGDMLCEHDKCFYRCADDRDCAAGMTCEHGKTICEYP